MRDAWGSFGLLLAVLLLFSGCAAVRPLKATPGVEMETLRTGVSVSVAGGGGNGNARGYLVFKRPDRMHVAIVSPFGSTLLELYGEGERILCLLPGKMAAYRGTVTDLAARGLLAEWSLMQWVLARPPQPGPVAAQGSARLGEKVFFYDNGLVQRKVASNGTEVLYRDYREVDGVPFPERVDISGGEGTKIHIVFDDPEVNRPIEEDLLTPKLEGYQVLPLAALPEKL